MKIETDGFAFQFTDTIDAFRFDEKDKTKLQFFCGTHEFKSCQ